MTKEDFIEAGYVNFGYFSPELSSKDTYPEYIKENVKDAVKKIKSYENENSFSFGFMTDIHYSDTENHNIRTKRLLNAYNEIKQSVDLRLLALGGDYVNDGKKEYKVNNYIKLNEFLKSENFFPVNGNHDDNSIWDWCIENEKSENHLSAKEIFDLFYSHLEIKGVTFGDCFGLYYFFDDKKNKVRYIFLDTCDIPYSVNKNGKFNYAKQSTFALSQNQIDWLINKALKFSEDNWSIIFVSHVFESFSEKSKTHETRKLDVLADIIDAYKNGENLNKTYYENEFSVKCNAEFSRYKRAEIVAYFCGHRHSDFEECTKSGVPVIYTDCTCFYEYKTPRSDGDKSELLFDIVTIQKDTKTIYTTRIGSGKDRVIKY